jgi:hypothetical protein
VIDIDNRQRKCLTLLEGIVKSGHVVVKSRTRLRACESVGGLTVSMTLHIGNEVIQNSDTCNLWIFAL